MSSSLAGRVVDDQKQEFGAAPEPKQAVQGSGGRGQGGSGEGELEFLDYVICSICGFPFHSKSGPNRRFWMTSCGHILCGDREHNHQKGRCTRCRKEDIETYPIDENIDPALQQWFAQPAVVVPGAVESLKRKLVELEEGAFSVAKFQTQELLRLIRHMRKNEERKDESIKIVRAELQKMSAMKKETLELRASNEALQKENEELKARLAQQHQQPQAISQQFPPHARQYAQAINPLTPVAEEGDEEGYGADSGPQSIRRFEMDLASGQGSSLQHGTAQIKSRFTTPRAMPSRITLPLHTDRPATTEPYIEARRSHTMQRVNLEKFRHSESSGPSTPQGFHPYHRPGSAMARPASARPYKNHAEYPSFMDGLPVNGQANAFAPAGPSLQQAYYDSEDLQASQSYPADNNMYSNPQGGMNY